MQFMLGFLSYFSHLKFVIWVISKIIGNGHLLEYFLRESLEKDSSQHQNSFSNWDLNLRYYNSAEVVSARRICKLLEALAPPCFHIDAPQKKSGLQLRTRKNVQSHISFLDVLATFHFW